MNKILDKIADLFRSILSDKKKLFICLGVFVFIIILLVAKGRSNKGPAGLGTEVGNVLNSDYYSASGNITVCNYNYDVTLAKALQNVQFGFSNSDIDYSNLITKYNNTLYFNTAPFVSKGGISSIKCAEPDPDAKESATLKEVFINSLNSDAFEYTVQEGYSEAKINSQENWEKYFTELATSLKENKDLILKNYTDAHIISKEIDTLIEDAQKLASSKASGNYITVTFSYSDEKQEYTLGIESNIDFESLPSFIDANSFDANKFTLLIVLNIKLVDNTINVPAGAVYSMGDKTINEFITDCWTSVFGRKDYQGLNEVTVKADSVTNVIKLGGTTETYQYLFDKDGVRSGALIVSSNDKNIIMQYIQTYYDETPGSDIEELIFYDPETKIFTFSMALSDSAIDSVNKIATTPNALGAFFKTAEGVVPIV